MILGHLIGKCTTTGFNFLVDQPTKKFEYVKVMHKEYGYVLCQVIELERDSEKTIAKCSVIGYKDKDNRIKQIREPLQPNTEILRADDEFIRDIIRLEQETKGAYIGKLDGKDINVFLDLRKLLTKHVSVLAKSGSGKSYTVGVLLEEIMEKNIPLLVIDPHGEYSTLKYPNEDKENMQLFNIEPKNFIKHIQEYGNPEINPTARPIKLNSNLETDELMHILPCKLNPNQQAMLYSTMKNLPELEFEALINELQFVDGSSKWNLISVIDYLRKLNLFSTNYTQYNELIQNGKCTIINLKGIDPEIQEIIVHKLMFDLFRERKKERIPPFFAIIEEAHNFAPERGFGEVKSSQILRIIASEGRKFGLGLCVVSQRPARVDKNVLSQCSTQIILKVTNPNDVKAITNSVEGINNESENEIQNLPIGTAMITGLVDMPLYVNIRPRKTKHGGMAVDMFEPEEDILDKIDEFNNMSLLPLIKPRTTKKDLRLMSEKEIDIKTFLIPAVLFGCEYNSNKFNILIERIQGKIMTDIEKGHHKEIPNIEELSPTQLEIIQLVKEKEFNPADLMTTLGIDFSHATSLVEELCKKGYLEYNGKYKINHNLMFNIEKCNFTGKIDFSNIEHDVKMKPKIEIDQIMNKIKNLANIKDTKECYIVWYETNDRTLVKK